MKDTFVRLEDKFIVDRQFEGELLSLLKEKLTPAYFYKDTEWTLIESLYFDSRSLHFFKDHFTKVKARYKLRIRRYAPNGVWNRGAAFIESKCKADGVCIKERLALDTDSYNRILAQKPLEATDDLRLANLDLPKPEFVKRVELMNKLIQEHGAVPVARVVYQRYAFEGDGVRVTIDENVQFDTQLDVKKQTASGIKKQALWNKAQEYGQKFSNQNSMIVEVKHSNNIPSWVNGFMARVGSAQTQFSKYCWSMSHILDQVAGSPQLA